KPQVAFFERFGAAGYAALERVLADAREAGVLLIADVKRGDVGSSCDAYADAWLSPGSPLESDAMTASAFQGFGTLAGALGHVTEHGKGLFVLVATSNPEAKAVQTARVPDGSGGDRSLSAQLLAEIAAFNAEHRLTAPSNADATAVGSVGAVLGATLNFADFGIDTDAERTPALPVLAPGFGHQGASVAEAGTIFGALGAALLVSESRSVLRGGSAGLAQRVREHAESIHSTPGRVRHG
ncbi:orotidine-5'-phosphate decarboxylase, partial [Leucobacter sp. M11]|uniref:orotidine-5'-phosphate decarboxylase n=1 Tax=Leucobacter sp. M11 TaxID=2993565 RepID=UPI002D806A0E